MNNGYITSLESDLKVTGQTRDQLPPVSTYRGGALARVDLWIKRQLKRATHWYVWEQVNFNSAVHHALISILAVLEEHERRISEIGNALEKQSSPIPHEPRVDSLEARVVTLELSLDEAQRVKERRPGNTQEELKLLLDEHRVCFKQLALQLSEVAITADRAQRRSQSQLEELASRIATMESHQTEIEEMVRASGSHHD